MTVGEVVQWGPLAGSEFGAIASNSKAVAKKEGEMKFDTVYFRYRDPAKKLLACSCTLLRIVSEDGRSTPRDAGRARVRGYLLKFGAKVYSKFERTPEHAPTRLHPPLCEVHRVY